MPQTYQRWQESQIKDALETMRVLMLVGPRQCGKTTLTKMLRHPSDIIYHTLDDPSDFYNAQNDPVDFVKHGDNLMIIDEVQLIPDLLKTIKLDVDNNKKPGRFLITGSSNIPTLPGIKESLAGRAQKIRLRPLAMGEINGTPPGFLQQAFAGKFETAHPKQEPDNKQSYLNYAMQGGYPEPRKISKQSKVHSWHDNYLSFLLDNDLKDVANIRKRDSMKKLVQILAAWSSKDMNVAQICSNLSITRETIENYIGALETLYLIERIPAWVKMDYQRLNRKDKLFMTDTGFMSAILGWQLNRVSADSDMTGKLLEVFAFTQLAAIIDANKYEHGYEIYYYRDKEKREIDFIVENSAGDMLGIEVKASSSVTTDAFKHLRWFKKNLTEEEDFKGIVLYTGERVRSFGDNMWAVPMNCMWS